MSRIYDALKRSGDRTDGDDRSETLRHRLDAMRVASPVDVGDYPEEQQAAPAKERPRTTDRAAARSSVVHRIAAVASRPKVPEAVEGKVIGDPSTPDVCVEQYRRLAAALHQAQAEHSIKTIMVSSAMPREGKTLTSTNLALTLSDSYSRRVLLIDADLRRPAVHDVFGLPNTVGLGDVLRSGLTPAPLVDVSPRLTVLPAGHADQNPIAGLTSERMKALLADAAKQFDWIILDSPPIGLLSDAALMRDLVDAAVLVIDAGATDYRLVQRAIAELGRERIIGVVLNRVDDQHMAPSEYYRHYANGPGPSGAL